MDDNIVQAEYRSLVKRGVVFYCKGYSLVSQETGQTFPVAMAKKMGLYPNVINKNELDAVWRK